MPKVSIIVPVYNVKEYLNECMDSILSQTLQDIEVICVNDGSTDGSPKILESYAELDSRVNILNKENTGYGDSMNQGIRAARGEYIGIVEPDDYVEPEMYEELYRAASESQVDWVKGDFQVFKGAGKDRRYSTVKLNIPGAQMLYYKVINPQNYPELIVCDDFHWKGIYQKEFLMRNGIAFHDTPGAAFQDNGFKYQTICMAQRVMYIKEARYWYRRDNPRASTYSAKGLELMYGEYRFIKEFMDKNFERTKVFSAAYFKKFYFQFQEQLKKILDREWKDVQPEKILDMYREALAFEIEQEYFTAAQPEEWLYREVRYFLRYPRSYYDFMKFQKEYEKEKYIKWLNHLQGRKVVLVCAGVKARQVINFLDLNHKNCIVAICDNDESKWGGMLYHFSVMPIEQAVKEYADGYFVIAKSGNTQELWKQLLGLGVSEESIENITVTLNEFSCLNCIL